MSEEEEETTDQEMASGPGPGFLGTAESSGGTELVEFLESEGEWDYGESGGSMGSGFISVGFSDEADADSGSESKAVAAVDPAEDSEEQRFR